jgi:hypothetical protein
MRRMLAPAALEFKRETVNCGKGRRDTATVDKQDQ